MGTTRRALLGTMIGAPAVLALPRTDALAQVKSTGWAARLQETDAVHGVNPANMDFSADPRGDFYRYANGGWLDRITIPTSRSSYGVFVELRQRTTTQLLGLLENLAGSDALEAGSDEWKAVELYRQGTDMATRNALGLEPIQGTLNRIAAISDLDQLHAFMRESVFLGAPNLLGVAVDADLADSSSHAIYAGGPPLGLPNRDYYFEDTSSNEAVRQAYITMCTEFLVHAGQTPEDARDAAQNVYAFEQKLASEILTREEQQDFSLIYNPMTVEQLSETYPLMDWPSYFAELGLEGVDEVIVTEPRYIAALPDILEDTPIEVLRNYHTLNLLTAGADYLSEDIEQTAFAYASVLSGTSEQLPREERVLSEVSDMFTDAVGKLYVGAYFPPEAKQRITDLVDELIAAFDARLEAANWMTPGTRDLARAKLAQMGVKVGYPDEWETYEGVEIGDSYAASILNVSAYALRRMFDKYGEPVVPSKWTEAAQTVNAFYNMVANDITFPAAILQPPFFDHEADPASNMGAIGYVIGHEITHGFDLGGAQFDADGNLTNWWTEEDYATFQDRIHLVADQYSKVEVLPDVFVNGQLTVGENVADLGGVQVGFDALAHHLEANGSSLDDVVTGPLAPAAPVSVEASPVAAFATPVGDTGMATPEAVENVQNLTQRQRFFIAAATVWRIKIRDEALITQVQTDEHAPVEVRGTQPLRNMDAFHEAFGIEEGDDMYLPSDERIVIW